MNNTNLSPGRIHELKLNEEDYPYLLSQIQDPPKTLYLLGQNITTDLKAVAIVGSRNTTDYGIEMAYRFSYEIAQKGIVVVSGLARGIDAVAHQACLDARGITIAVIAGGLDKIYPTENRRLASEICKKGCLISEFPEGTAPLGKYFLQRNRIISGISLAVIVVGGARRSGTISTATHAANQGREVFAIPGPINEEFSQASLYLIENGARVADSPQTVIDYLNEISPI